MAGAPAAESIPNPDALRSIIDDIPLQASYLLTEENGSFRTTVMPEACKDCGHSLEEPGSNKQYYFEEQELLVIDLSRP